MHRLFVAASALLLPLSARAETLTYPDLVHRLTDMEHLATVPPAGEKTALASSYDRKSQYDAATDKYIEWGANGDGTGYIREEGKHGRAGRHSGRGLHLAALVRGARQRPPEILSRWLEHAGGRCSVQSSAQSRSTGRFIIRTWSTGNRAWRSRAHGFVPGADCFVPICFAKSCKIVGDKAPVPDKGNDGWGMYFQATYTVFAPGTKVPTFSLPLSSEDDAALKEADAKEGRAGEPVFGPPCGRKRPTRRI